MKLFWLPRNQRCLNNLNSLFEQPEDVVDVHRTQPSCSAPIHDVAAIGILPQAAGFTKAPPTWQAYRVAIIDTAGFISDLKDHATDHGFHIHDERHFVETYSMRQAWEVDLHPEEVCGGPLDLHLSLEVDPRTLFAFEDVVLELPEGTEPPDVLHLPLNFTWSMPPLPHCPDLLVLATELAGIGGPDLPLEVSAIDSFASVTDAAERSIGIIARVDVSLSQIFMGTEDLCAALNGCLDVSHYLLERAPHWLGLDYS